MLLVEVDLEVRVVLGHEHLIVDVAEVVKGLIAAETVLLIGVVGLLANRAFPFANRLLLISHPV